MTPYDQNVAERSLRDYLLGRLHGDARDRLDELLFSDDEVYRNLQTARSELIDDYVTGRLDAVSRSDCERLVLSTRDGRRELMIAKGMLAHYGALANQRPTPSWFDWFRPFAAPAFTTASIAAVAVLSVLYFLSQARVKEFAGREERLRDQIAQAERRIRELHTNPAAEPSGEKPVLMAGDIRFNLQIDDRTRDNQNRAGQAPLLVPGTVAAVDLHVRLEGELQADYTASLRKASDPRLLWKGTPSSVNGRALTSRVPRSAFQEGRYRFVLHGHSDGEAPSVIGEYNFTVRLQP